MHKFFLIQAAIVVASVIFSACGSATTKPTNDQRTPAEAPPGSSANNDKDKPLDPNADRSAVGSRVYATSQDLPSCTKANDGVLAYVADIQALQACTNGTWRAVEIKNSDSKDEDRSFEMKTAMSLYNDYRKSIFRVSMQCVLNQPAFGSCSNKQARAVLLGTAFLCASNTLCTNRHVAFCPDCYALEQIRFQATKGTTDSINADGQPAEPFLVANSTNGFVPHPSLDLVKIPATTAPREAKPLPITTAPIDTSLQALDPILAMSFPLGMQDLYVDVAYVNTKYIGECDSQGGTAGYGCPSKDYDFSTSNDTDHGSSGSPLIHIGSGKVVGITAAGTEGENANFTWAIDAFRLNEIR